MSTDSPAADRSLSDRVLGHLRRRHSPAVARRATVETADPDAGTVALSFGCGCSGGLSPPQRASLRQGLVEDLRVVETVLFESGCGCSGGRSRGQSRSRDPGGSDGSPTAPF